MDDILTDDDAEDDEEAYEAWRLRELGRIGRDRELRERETREAAEKERWRAMSEEERRRHLALHPREAVPKPKKKWGFLQVCRGAPRVQRACLVGGGDRGMGQEVGDVRGVVVAGQCSPRRCSSPSLSPPPVSAEILAQGRLLPGGRRRAGGGRPGAWYPGRTRLLCTHRPGQV